MAIKKGATTPTITELFNDVATAINNKTGNTGTIPATEFADAIDNIHVLNGIDEIITPETPVAYYDADAEEPKQLDSEDSGNYLMYVDGGYGVTKTAYVGELESGAPYVYKNDTLDKLNEGVYNVYENSGMQVEQADSTYLNSGNYYYAESGDRIYYTDGNPLQEANFSTYTGLYYLDGAEVVDGSDMTSLNSGLYYSDGSTYDRVNLYQGFVYLYNGDDDFSELQSGELYYINSSSTSTVSVNPGEVYTYNGYGTFTKLDCNALYRTYDHYSNTAAEKLELPADADHPTYVTISGVQYKISRD